MILFYMNSYISKTKIIDFIVAYSYILPIISRWVLPSSIEQLFVIDLLGAFPFYTFDILYFFFIIFATKRVNTKRVVLFKLMFISISILSFLSIIINDYISPKSFLISNQYFLFSILLFSFYKFTDNQLNHIKIPLLVSFFTLVVEIIIFSLKISTYELNIIGENYGGVYRISTTIGAATGTGIIIFLLGGFLCYLHRTKKAINIVILSLTLVTTFMTLSRGASIAVAIFSIPCLISLFGLNKINLKVVTRSLLALSVIIFIGLRLGLISPLIERVIALNEADRVMANRDNLFQKTYDIFLENCLFGVGNGNIFPTKDVQYSYFKPKYASAPHNTFLLLLGENGIFSFIPFFIIVLLLIFSKHKKDNLLLYTLMILTFLILFNTEAIWIDEEYCFFLSIIISCLLTDTGKYYKKPASTYHPPLNIGGITR